MTGHALFSANLLLAYTAYFVGVASPGPSNLAIMSVATNHGRKAAFAFALGIISGSMSWALLATLGVSAILTTWSHLIVAIKIFGGLYLLWLAFKSGRSALAAKAIVAPDTEQQALKSLYTRGLLLHLTNPKAILTWVSIVALGSSGSAESIHGAVIPGCVVIGCLVFSGYAALFSTRPARRIYARIRRGLEGCLAVVFAIAGVKLLTSRA